MRHRTASVPLIRLGIGALLLTGCSVTSGARASDATPAPGSATGFRARAEQVAAAWTGSAAERVWRSGYIPVQDTAVPAADAFHNQSDKAEFFSGRVTVAVPLPTVASTGTVRWGSGGTLTLPRLGLVQALRATGDGSCPTTSCPADLVVTSAEPTTMRVATSRGGATVPAWSFHLLGYQGAFLVAAVAPSGGGTDSSGIRPVGVDPSILPAYVRSVSADGRTLTLEVGDPSCGRIQDSVGVNVYETSDVVVVGSWDTPAKVPPGTLCAADATDAVKTVHLARPLGTRVVLDAVMGTPQLPRP